MESFNPRKRQKKRVIKKVYDLLGQPSYMYMYYSSYFIKVWASEDIAANAQVSVNRYSLHP